MGKLNGFKSLVIIVCICLCSIPRAYGEDCSSPVQPIEKGMAAQCSGFLFSDKAESDAYKATRLVELQKEENQILQKRLDLYIKQSEVLAKELGKKNNTEELYRIGYFVAGILITGYLATNLK